MGEVLFLLFYNKIEFFRSAALVGTAIAKKVVDENIYLSLAVRNDTKTVLYLLRVYICHC